MALYGTNRDISLMRHISKELVDRMIGQQVGYYKLSLSETVTDLYGDSKKKMYNNPIMITCLIDRNPQVNEKNDSGTTTVRTIDFRFLRDDLMDISLVPEKGDIIMWEENYYEVENVVNNQYVVGKDPDYSLKSDLEKFGRSWSIICNCYLTNVNKLNIIKSR